MLVSEILEASISTIKPLLEHVSNETLAELLESEKTGKNRKTLMATINSKLNKTEKKSYVCVRKSTLQHAVYRDYVTRQCDVSQPKFDAEAEKKKQEIWGYVKGHSAFGESKCRWDGGDHIYGVRENPGKISTDTLWGKIPCTHEQNVSWKRYIKSDGSKGKLTDDVIDETSLHEKERINLDKLRAWAKYCEERGATLSYPVCPELEKKWEEIIIRGLSTIDADCRAATETQIPVSQKKN